MRRVALIVALVLIAGAGLWGWRQHLVGRLMLLAPSTRVENFRHMDRLFPSRPVRRGDAVFTFDRALRPVDVRYQYDGTTRRLDDFLAATSTTGFLVIQSDRIVDERYFLGAGEDSQLTSWSVAKSFISALIGTAIDRGEIAGVERPITDYVPALRQSGYDGVPIRDILQMSSGVRFDEDYANPFSDVNWMFMRSFLFGGRINATPEGVRRARPPGRQFDYVSVDTQALGMLLTRATGKPIAALAEERLWRPLGMEHDAFWITDRAGADGMEYAFCCLNATVRDYAKLGRLFLRGGDWNGHRIVSEPWVRESVTPGRPDLVNAGQYTPDWAIGYQYQWWVPEGPDGEFTGIGVWGQYLYVNPAANSIIVKTSVDPGFDTRDMETITAFRAVVAARR